MKHDMITLLYHIINPGKVSKDVFYFKDMYPLFKLHSLEPFLAQARNNGLLISSSEETIKLDKIYKTAIYKTAVQEEEFILIKESLSSQEIPFLPLKGSLIRNLYPSPELRTMADLDILVPKKELKNIKKMMVSLGYDVKHQGGNHDIYYKLPFMNVEMHRRMIDESYELSSYYDSIWDKVKAKEDHNSEQMLSDEDTYLFIVAHSAKHYGGGGTGVRSVLDIYFYLKHFIALDERYIQEELKNLHLTQYEQNLRTLAFGWFERKSMNDAAVVMGDYIIRSGVYGMQKNAVVSAVSMETGSQSLRRRKIKYLWKRAFLPYKSMKTQFPSLRYMPLLLPVFYGYRLCKGLFSGKVLSQTKEVSHIKETDVTSHQAIKEKTGGTNEN